MYNYSHGGNAVFEDGASGILDLSANINPLGIPSGVAEAIIDEIKFCTRYPDNFSEKLRRCIAAHEGVDSNHVFCGNGASDIIFRIPIALKTERALISAPTFSDYERALRSYGAATVDYYMLQSEPGFKPNEEILKKIEDTKPDLIYLCNPNNPTGVLTETALLNEIIRRCEKTNTHVVVDECFIDFTGRAGDCSCKPLLSRYSNLIILKAFTKLFALPGIRLGYAMSGNTRLLQALYFHGADWAVSNLAQAAGMAALVNAEEYIKDTIDYVARERNIIKSALVDLGYTVYESSANYVFFKNPYPFDLKARLDEMGIRIRSCANYVGLDATYYRVGVSQEADNIRLINGIREASWQKI